MWMWCWTLMLVIPSSHAITSTYALKPVIQVSADVLNNGIDGFVDKSLLASNVVVTAQQNDGTTIRATVPNMQTGEFFLGRLPITNGTCPNTTCYNLVITADGYVAAVIAAVPVASSSSITLISTSTTSFTFTPLQSSTSHSISGTVTLLSIPPPMMAL